MGLVLLPRLVRVAWPASPSGRRLPPASRPLRVIFGSVSFPHIAAQAVNRSLWVAVTVRNPDPEGFSPIRSLLDAGSGSRPGAGLVSWTVPPRLGLAVGSRTLRGPAPATA